MLLVKDHNHTNHTNVTLSLKPACISYATGAENPWSMWHQTEYGQSQVKEAMRAFLDFEILGGSRHGPPIHSKLSERSIALNAL